jgi:hypothetical protein
MERVSRRKILAAAGSGAALAGALVGASAVSAQPTRPPGGGLTEWVERYALVFDIPASDSLRQQTGPASPTGPAYWTGTLWPDGAVGADGKPAAGARQLGVWRASVWVYVPGVQAQFTGVHSLDIFTRGQIVASGVTDSSVAITGGTGEFQGARGEVRMANLGTGAGAITLEVEAIGPTPGR